MHQPKMIAMHLHAFPSWNILYVIGHLVGNKEKIEQVQKAACFFKAKPHHWHFHWWNSTGKKTQFDVFRAPSLGMESCKLMQLPASGFESSKLRSPEEIKHEQHNKNKWITYPNLEVQKGVSFWNVARSVLAGRVGAFYAGKTVGIYNTGLKTQ